MPYLFKFKIETQTWLRFLWYDRFITLTPRSLILILSKENKIPYCDKHLWQKATNGSINAWKIFQPGKSWLNEFFVCCIKGSFKSTSHSPSFFALVTEKKSDWTRKVEKEGNSNHIYVNSSSRWTRGASVNCVPVEGTF